MTDNMREALRLQKEKARIKTEQQRTKEKEIATAVGSTLATIASIALMLL